MLEITLKQLEAFVFTAEYSSFTRAAEKLYLTQSTVSAHIHALETALDAQLIVRGSRKKFALTEDGKRVYMAARDILARCQALQDMSVMNQNGELSVGTSTVPAQHLLPALMSGFLRKHSDTRYLLRRGDTDQVHQMLDRGEVRIGLVGAALDRRNYTYHGLIEDRLVVVTANNQRFQALRERSVRGCELLLSESVIAREESSGTQHVVDAYLRQKQISPSDLRMVARMDNPEAIKTSVAQNMGVSILSQLAVREEVDSGKLLSFDLDPEGTYRKIYIVWRKDTVLTPLEQRFVNYISAEAKNLYH